MNERTSGGRMRRWAATLILVGLGVTGAVGIGAYEVVHASSTSTSDSTSSGGLSSGSGASMTQSGGS